MELQKSPKEIPPLLLVRERVEAMINKKVTVAVSAMREDELQLYILNWRTTEEEALSAYEKLQQLVPEKYPSVNTLI